jgi:phenylacetate-CoA ligase
VHFAAGTSNFYGRLYRDAGVNLAAFQGRADLVRLPIVDPSPLIDQPEDVVSKAANPYRVSCSSGTALRPKVLFRTAQDSAISTEVMCRLFKMAGLERGGQLLIGQPFDLAHLGYLSLEACRRLGVLAIPIGLSISDGRFAQFVKSHPSAAMFSSPSRMDAMTKRISGEGWRVGLNPGAILLAGEPISQTCRDRLQAFWGIEPHDLYGSEETDGLAGSCEHHAGLHFMDDKFVLEVLDPSTGVPVPEGELGMAVITSLYARGTPLIRYRLGDLVRRDREPCLCGRPWPLIAVHGRGDDTVLLYDGIKVSGDQLELAIRQVVPSAGRIQFVWTAMDDGVTELRVVIGDTHSAIGAELAARLEEAIWTASLDIEAARAIGCLRVRVTADPTDLRTTARGKVPRMVDDRRTGNGQGLGGQP